MTTGSAPQSPEPGPTEEVSIVRRLREAAHGYNIDPIAELFNEALRYATDGHFRMARDRLHILLCMAPDDGEARLMLARVHAADGLWDEARSELERADQIGAPVPAIFRRAVEEGAQAKRASEEQQRRPSRDRDDTDLRNLRAEANRLRAENGQQVTHIAQLHREVRRWAWLTAAVSTLAIGFIAVTFTFSGEPSHDPAPMAKGMPTFGSAAQIAPHAMPTVGEASAAPTDQPLHGSPEHLLLEQVNRALGADPSFGRLIAKVRGTEITLSGAVAVAADLARAQAAVDAIGTDLQVTGPSPGNVNADDVWIVALEFGTTHTVQEGDELIPLAVHYYGKSKHWRTIEADNDLEGKPLRPGAKIAIPPIHPSTR